MNQNKNSVNTKVSVGESSKKRKIAVFLHGFATSPTDLKMIAEEFANFGFEIRSPWLAGHPITAESIDNVVTISEIKDSVLVAIKDIDITQCDVYLIGFSLGGAVAIDIASDLSLAGVLAINPFFETAKPRMTKCLLLLATLFPKIPRKRRFQTTIRQSREFLSHEVSILPLEFTREIIEKSSILGTRIRMAKCPIIIVHSLNDQVAAFSASANLVKSAARSDIRLVPIYGLNHFFYYLNRIDSFIRIHIEPLYCFPPWLQSRTRAEATGTASRWMTNFMSIPVVLIPWITATGILLILPLLFPDRIGVFIPRNNFLHIFYVSSYVMGLCSMISLSILQRHTNHVVYGIPAPISTTLEIEKQISRLYASVLRGAYGSKKGF